MSLTPIGKKRSPRMKVYYGIGSIQPAISKSVVAIGIFDGVHRGHQNVIARLTRYAKVRRVPSVIVTFDPHPSAIVRRPLRSPTIISLEHRLRLIESLGVNTAVVIRFDKRFSLLTPGRFIQTVFIDALGARRIFVGENFRFGAGGAGTIGYLRAKGDESGFTVGVIKRVKVRGRVVSSTLIRSSIVRGDLRSAAALLGRRDSVLGTVIHGAKRGRILGFPTANIDPHHEAIPPSGVYAVMVRIGGAIHRGVLNIGRRPTFSSQTEPTVEVHIFGYSGNLYGDTIEALFVKRLRSERRFKTRQGLIRQIQKDVDEARRAL